MATMEQLEEGNLSSGLLPPLTELFLEIQVNKLIKEYLFSSTADECPTSLYAVENGLWEYKQNKAWSMPPSDHLFAKDTALQSACNAPCSHSARALNDHCIQIPHEPHSLHRSTRVLNDLHMQSSQDPHISLYSIAHIEDKDHNVKEQMVPGDAQSLQAVNAVCDSSLGMESGGKKLHNHSHLSRVDTFPCAKTVETHVSARCKADTEVKSSCKKPPRPPRLPKSPPKKLNPILTRCLSDSGTVWQSLRRVKPERKRKATAASSVWALFFTFCFVIIMIAQGFLSQGSPGRASYYSNASSPMETDMKASTLVAPGQVSLAGAEGALVEGVSAQSYVMRKVKAQHLSDMKHFELDAFPKS